MLSLIHILVEAGWDAEAARRPQGQHTMVVVHLDVEQRAAALHLGPLLSDAERRYLTCDATCEVWFERHGEVIGAGRTTRVINRRVRRALEHRDRTCAVPGCGATRGLHAHHLRHWEDGGPTELANLVLLCPYHHLSLIHIFTVFQRTPIWIAPRFDFPFTPEQHQEFERDSDVYKRQG